MQTIVQCAASRSARRTGFTLVELLVVIAIIGTLIGLLVPGAISVRIRSRQTQCTNNQYQLGLAALQQTNSAKQHFPGYVFVQKLGPDAGGGKQAFPWPAKLLPDLDRQDVWDHLLSNGYGEGFDGGKGDPSNDFDAPPVLSVFACPSDASINPQVAALTYGINSGFWDNNAPLTATGVDYAANGIAHDRRRPGAPRVQGGASGIKDGAATTLLFAENTQKDDQISGSPVFATWLGPVDPAVLGYSPEQLFGFTWIANSDAPGEMNAFLKGLQAPFNSAETPPSYGLVGARFARPSSDHPEVFIATFADGHTQSIAKSIDYRVYQQLMTPNGAKARNPADPGTFLRGFMKPPLSESDY